MLHIAALHPTYNSQRSTILAGLELMICHSWGICEATEPRLQVMCNVLLLFCFTDINGHLISASHDGDSPFWDEAQEHSNPPWVTLSQVHMYMHTIFIIIMYILSDCVWLDFIFQFVRLFLLNQVCYKCIPDMLLSVKTLVPTAEPSPVHLSRLDSISLRRRNRKYVLQTGNSSSAETG
jgi:hypothetical protein